MWPIHRRIQGGGGVKVVRAATVVDSQTVVNQACSFGESNLARSFPLSDEVEQVHKILEVDAQVTEDLRTTAGQKDFDPSKP